ncbi:MAG: hypothetical protein ACR2QH_19495 [Geminicoccaceae bacterium]|jgi:hypothetical protein
MEEKNGRDWSSVLSRVGDVLLLGIGCLAWLAAVVLMVLLIWS